MFEMKPYEVYIKVDDDSYIVAVNSSAFLLDTNDWVKIDEGYGDKYHHAQNNYFSEFLITDSGVYRYKYIDDVVIECTAEEIAEQEANLPVPDDVANEARITELEAALEALTGVKA